MRNVEISFRRLFVWLTGTRSFYLHLFRCFNQCSMQFVRGSHAFDHCVQNGLSVFSCIHPCVDSSPFHVCRPQWTDETGWMKYHWACFVKSRVQVKCCYQYHPLNRSVQWMEPFNAFKALPVTDVTSWDWERGFEWFIIELVSWYSLLHFHWYFLCSFFPFSKAEPWYNFMCFGFFLHFYHSRYQNHLRSL